MTEQEYITVLELTRLRAALENLREVDDSSNEHLKIAKKIIHNEVTSRQNMAGQATDEPFA
jgi:hypothetical protein